MKPEISFFNILCSDGDGQKERRGANYRGLVGIIQALYVSEKVWLLSSLLYLTQSQAKELLVHGPEESIQSKPYTIKYCPGFLLMHTAPSL